MSTYQFICGGCGKELDNIEELNGSLKKTCPDCGYSLFMITTPHSTEEDLSLEVSIESKQYEMISFIQEYMKENNYAPSIKEIQEVLSFKSVSTVYYHLNLLKEKGYITFKQGRMNTLRILPKAINNQELLPLSDKQIRLLEVIDKYVQEHKDSPTNQELQQILGFKSIATLVHHLNRLQDLSLIDKSRYRHRSIILTDKGIELLHLLGKKDVEG